MATSGQSSLAHELEQAILYAELVGQHAPGGHIIFSELARAREILDWLQEDDVYLATGQVTPRVRAQVAGAMASLDQAVNLVRVDPNKPLSPARWSNALPKGWIWGGLAAAVVVGAVLFWDAKGRA